MSLIKKYIPISLLCIAFTTTLVYVFLLREQVLPAIHGKATPWFQQTVNLLYPRLGTENVRFSPSFFVAKADQVIIRFTCTLLALAAFSFLLQINKKAKERLDAHFDTKVNTRQAGTLITFIYLYLIYTSWDIFFEYQGLHGIQAFYQPVFPLKFINSNFPSPVLFGIIFAIFILSGLLTALRYFPLLNAILCITSFLYLYSIRMGFEKIDHGFTTIIYTLLITPYLIVAWKNGKRDNSNTINAWSIALIRIVIPLCYFMAALEKIFISGTTWLQASNFKTLLYLHQIPLGLWVMQSTFLCTALPLLGWLFQFSFVAVIRWPKLIPYFLIAGVLFHEGTYFLFGAGDPFSPWIAVYVFFLIPLQQKEENTQ